MHKWQKNLIKLTNFNFKYEIVKNSDHSLSNYLTIKYPHIKYLNIEARFGDFTTQKKLLSKILKII
jgi:hypothetical protein